MRAVPDHDTNADEVDTGAEDDEVFVMVGVFDDEADDDGGYGGGEGESLGYVSGCGDRGAVHDLEIGVEVGLDGGVEDS